MESIDLKDILSLAITSIAIVVSLYLGVLGYMITTRSKNDSMRISAIEEHYYKEKRALFGVRFISSLFLNQLNNSLAATDIIKRLLEKIISDKNKNYSEADIEIMLSTLNEGIKPHLSNMHRYGLYGKALNTSSEEFEGVLSELVLRYQDFETLEFLQTMSEIETGEYAQSYIKCAQSLKSRIRLVDSSLWTG